MTATGKHGSILGVLFLTARGTPVHGPQKAVTWVLSPVPNRYMAGSNKPHQLPGRMDDLSPFGLAFQSAIKG